MHVYYVAGMTPHLTHTVFYFIPGNPKIQVIPIISIVQISNLKGTEVR